MPLKFAELHAHCRQATRRCSWRARIASPCASGVVPSRSQSGSSSVSASARMDARAPRRNPPTSHAHSAGLRRGAEVQLERDVQAAPSGCATRRRTTRASADSRAASCGLLRVFGHARTEMSGSGFTPSPSRPATGGRLRSAAAAEERCRSVPTATPRRTAIASTFASTALTARRRAQARARGAAGPESRAYRAPGRPTGAGRRQSSPAFA